MIFSETSQQTKTSTKLQEKLDVELKKQQKDVCSSDDCKCGATSEKLAWVTKQTGEGKVGMFSGVDGKKK